MALKITKMVITKTAHLDLSKVSPVDYGNRAGVSAGLTIEVEVAPNQSTDAVLAEGLAFVDNALYDQLMPAIERMPDSRRESWLALLGCAPAVDLTPAAPKFPRGTGSPFEPAHRGMSHTPLSIPATAITFEPDPEYVPPSDDAQLDDTQSPDDWDETETQDDADAPPVELEPDQDDLDIQRAEDEGMKPPFVWNTEMYVQALRLMAREHGHTMPFGLSREDAIAHMREHFPECEQVKEAEIA